MSRQKEIFYFLIIHQLNCELHLILFFQHFQAHRSPLNSPEKIQTSTVLSNVLLLEPLDYIVGHVLTIIAQKIAQGTQNVVREKCSLHHFVC